MNQDPDTLDIQRLIHYLQIVCRGKLVKQYTDFDSTSYRILEQPFTDLLFDDLIKGSWTVEELSKKHGVNKKDVREVLSGLMKDLGVLEDGYISRRTGRDEREGKRINLRYSLIPIPIHARIFDPTLGFSLLGWSAFLNTIDQSRFLPQKEDLLHYYCQKIASFWEMPPGKVEHYFGNHQLSYISTVYGPLPALESDELYVSIKNKIADDPEMLGNRFRRRNLNKEHQKYERYLMQGPGTIPELQYLVLNLHDILSFCALNRVESEIERFQEINMRLFGMIFMIPESVILGRPSNSSDNQDLVMSNERPEMMKADNKSEIHRSVWQNHVMKKAMLSLESRNISARVSAVRMMRNGNVPIDIEFLKRVLEDNIASVQLEVLRTIREHFIPFPPHALYQVEHSRERRVRHAAIDAISSISSQEALEVLEKIALENPRDSAKRAIRAIIIKKDADVDPILYKIIETTKDSQIRAFALHHVDGNRSREIVPLLIKCLDDSQISVRSAAVSALAKIGAPDAFEVFKKRYSVESSKNVKDLLKKEILNIKPDLRLESSTEIIDSQPIRIKNLSESQIAESDSLKRTESFSWKESACGKHRVINDKSIQAVEASNQEIFEREEEQISTEYLHISQKLESEHIDIRIMAIRYIQQHFTPNFTLLVISALDNIPSVQRIALTIIQENNLAISAKHFRPAIKSRDTRIKFATLETIEKIPCEGAPALLREVVHKCPSSYVKPAINALLNYPREETIPIITGFLDLPNPDIKIVSADALGKIKAKSASGALLEGLTDTRYQVRLACMQALLNIGYQGIIDIFKDRSENDPSKFLRKAAVDMIAFVGQDTSSASQKNQAVEEGNNNPLVRDLSAKEKISPISKDSILDERLSDNIHSHIAVIDKLGKTRDPLVIEHFIQILSNDCSIPIRVAVLRNLSEFDDPRILPIAMEVFSSGSPEIRCAAVPLIAKKGGHDGLKFLEEHIDDFRYFVRRDICKAFESHGNIEHIPLLEHFREDPFEEVSVAAEEAIQIIRKRENAAPKN